MRYAWLLLLILAGCGYHLAGEQLALPEDVSSLGVGTIANQSREHGLEKTLAFAFEREIHVRRHYRMEEDPAGADAVLSGTIRELNARPVAFSAQDQAVQYEIALVMDLSLTRQRDGRVLWHISNLKEIDEYTTSAPIVVTSSSEFQQGTLDAGDLQNPQFSRPRSAQVPQPISIQLAESERRRAITRLLQRAVHDVYNQMVEDF